MLGSQARHLERILLHIREIASTEAELEGRDPEAYVDDLIERRPHQVFLIDGARGSGKTTLLLIVQHYLKFLGRPKHWKDEDPGLEQTFLREYSDGINRELEGVDPKWKDKFAGFRDKHAIRDERRITTYYLPVLFPSDLELRQSVMEGVLSLMAKMLDREIARCGQRPEDKQLLAAAQELRDEIDNKVTAGWFLSRSEGTDAILRDSADYQEYLEKRGKANVDSFGRVEIWRHFVNKFLNFFHAELLTVCFDDTDVATSISRDILHTARIFLDHPRIVTIVAGNLHSIRQSLVLDELKSLGAPIDALTESSARDWRRRIRHETEEFLEKVLPRRFRYYIASSRDSLDPHESQNEPGAAGGEKRSQSDFARVFGVGLDRLCAQMLDKSREPFLRMRHRAHLRWLEDRQEVTNEDEHGQLENYLSWWVFRHWYADHLRPRTIRHMAAMRAYTGRADDSGFVVDLLKSEHRKRLAVILFESPENYEIVHRLGDDDYKVLAWLHRQIVESSWRGDRYIQINGRRIYENTYSYHFLLYRLDLGIAMPIQDNPEDLLPRGLLPVPDGPNLSKDRSFFPRNRGQRLYGVAADLNHSLVPANCIYLCDADVLPDTAWAPPSDSAVASDSWERRLKYGWHDLFFFDLEELKAGFAGQPTGLAEEEAKEKSHDRHVSEYLIHTVIPFATAPLGDFFATRQEFSDRDVGIGAVAKDTLLAAEFSTKTHLTALPAIDALTRKRDYLAQLAGDPAATDVIKILSEPWQKVMLDGIPLTEMGDQTPLAPSEEVLRLVGPRLISYRWLINDVRRAWHAARIFINQVSGIARKYSAAEASGTGDNAPEATRRERFFREDRYTVGTRAALQRWLERSNSFRAFISGFQTPAYERVGVVEDDKCPGFLKLDPDHVRNDILRNIAELIGWGGDSSLKAGLDPKSVQPIALNLSNRQLKALLTTRAPDDELAGANSTHPFFFLDPLDHGDSPTAERARARARYARSFLLFLYGFAPTMPSLIHIEVAAAAQADGWRNTVEFQREANAILGTWETWIKRFLEFARCYRSLLEIAKLRLDILELWRLAHGDEANAELEERLGISDGIGSTSFGVWMTLTPDMSFASVGIHGISNLDNLNFDRTTLDALQTKLLEKREAWGSTNSKPGRATWRPELDDACDHLVEAANFIRTLHKVIETTVARTN